MLTIKNITKTYASTTSLHKVSFEVSENSITGIIGPNGTMSTGICNIKQNGDYLVIRANPAENKMVAF